MLTQLNILGMMNELINAGVGIGVNAGAPTSGTSGTGVGIYGPGSLLIDTTNKFLYINTNTLASPTWTKVGTQT